MTQLQDDLAALRIDRHEEPSGAGRRWIVWIVVCVVLGGVAFGGWRWLTRERPTVVQVATVSSRDVGMRASVLNATGYVTARRRATVSSKVTGKVVEVNVEEGMAVREGQVLARLDDTTPRASLALAESQVEAARAAVLENEVRLEESKLLLGRVGELRKRGLATATELDSTQATTDSLAARIAALRQQVTVAERQVAVQQTDIDNTIIRAPFSGVAISKDAQPGEMVSPVSAGGGFTRTGISTIVDMRSLEIEVDVNESYINRVQAGQPVTAQLDAYPDWQIPAHVITTIPSADRQKATVLVRIGFDKLDPRLLPDMGVKVTFLRPEGDKGAAPAAVKPATLVPRAAVRAEGAASVVFVIAGDRVERRAITTGGTDGDRLEVTSGLSPGDRVVVSPPESLASGSLVVTQ